MQDKLLIVHPTSADEYYKQAPMPPMGWQKRTAPTVEQIDKAHDNLKKLVQEKDRMIEQANGLVAVVKRERRWRKMIISAFAATWATIIVVLKILIPYAIKGMMR